MINSTSLQKSTLGVKETVNRPEAHVREPSSITGTTQHRESPKGELLDEPTRMKAIFSPSTEP